MLEGDRLESLVDRIPVEWGKEIRFNQGWDEIVTDLDKYLAHIFPDYIIHQMKEKFGVLRFYWATGEDAPKTKEIEIGLHPVDRNSWHARFERANALVTAAEVKSGMTCEICGNWGKPSSTYWIKTLCETCLELEKMG